MNAHSMFLRLRGGCLLIASIMWIAASSALSQELHPVPYDDAARLKTRVLCSCLFVQNLSMEQCANSASAIWRYPFRDAPTLLETGKQRIEVLLRPSGGSVQFFDGGMAVARSLYIDDGGGCVTWKPGAELDTELDPELDGTVSSNAIPLPRVALPRAIDAKAVQNAIDEGFAAPGPLAGFARAALVAYDGRVVMERYAPGFGPHNRYYLGSISKLFNNLLAGLLVRDGKLQVEEPVAFPEWQAPNDPRREITFDHLLHMTSGLDWNEDFFKPGAPAYDIYFAGPASLDVAQHVVEGPLEAEPGAHFEYSTGAATLLASALQARLGEKGRAPLLRYFSQELFQPMGATGIVPEFDAAGTFLAGHSVYARPEDLLRIGLLLLQEGQWNGRQLLPPKWVEYSTKPVSTSEGSVEDYGAQLALDMAGVSGCFGHAGVGQQFLVVCPERKLVLVWFSSFYDFSGRAKGEPDAVLRKLILAFPERRDAGKRDGGVAGTQGDERCT